MLLAIDTATRNASIALFGANGVRAERSWLSRENHTVELMGEIISLLEIAAVPRGGLSSIAVALGPGSFTGLRVGMSVAKGIAFGNRVPLVGIPTLDAVAHAFGFQRTLIWAILSAGRGKYSVAVYKAQRGKTRRVSDYVLVNAVALAELARAPTGVHSRLQRCLFCGEVDAGLAKTLSDELGPLAEITPPSMNLRRAGYLAELAWARLTRGEQDDVESLAPFYAAYGGTMASAGASPGLTWLDGVKSEA